MWYWYVARPNELFIDCDRWEKSKDHIRRRIMGAIECEKLFVENVFLYPSQTSGHMHMIVLLDKTKRLPNAVEKYCWEIMFHSDIYRECCNFMRSNLDSLTYYNLACDVLIANSILHRYADRTCGCTEKHSYKVMESCPAAIDLRGEYRRTTFFGKPSNNPCPWF